MDQGITVDINNNIIENINSNSIDNQIQNQAPVFWLDSDSNNIAINLDGIVDISKEKNRIFGEDFRFQDFVEVIKSRKFTKEIYENIALLLKFFKVNILNYEKVSVNPLTDKMEYKFRHLYSFFENFLRLKSLTHLLNNNPNDYMWLLNLIIKIDKSQYLLKFLDIEKICNNITGKLEFLVDSSILSPFPTFMVILNSIPKNFYSPNSVDHVSRSCLIGSLKNSDSRVFKHVIDNYKMFFTYFDSTKESTIKLMIRTCLSSYMPKKFRLKKIKIIDSIFGLKDYYECMLDSVRDHEIMLILKRYYGVGYEYKNENIDMIINNLLLSKILSIEDGYEENYYISNIFLNKLLELFDKDEDKGKFILSVYTKVYCGSIIERYKEFVEKAPYTYLVEVVNNVVCKLVTKLDHVLKSSRYDTLYYLLRKIDESTMTNLVNVCLTGVISRRSKYYQTGITIIFPFVKYFVFSNAGQRESIISSIEQMNLDFANNKISAELKDKGMIRLLRKLGDFKLIENTQLRLYNKLKFELRVYARKCKKVYSLEKKVEKVGNLLKIDSFNPASSLMVSSKDTGPIKGNYLKFNTIPPRNLFVNELSTMEGKIVIIREKADGYQVDCLPFDIEPEWNNIDGSKESKIKSEFIDDLDLYLVFDIEINYESLDIGWKSVESYNENKYTNDIEERYNLLRSNHPYTKDRLLNKEPIRSYEDLINELSSERRIFERFLEDDYECYRYYPKGAWKIELTQDLIKSLNNVFSSEGKVYKNKVNYDGFIISPLDGNRELKIKPINKQTIDLAYNNDNNSFEDRDNISWNNMIINTENIDEKVGLLQHKSIYRFEPVFLSKSSDEIRFQIESHRFDKKRPNPNKVVCLTVGLVRYGLDRIIKDNRNEKSNQRERQDIDQITETPIESKGISTKIPGSVLVSESKNSDPKRSYYYQSNKATNKSNEWNDIKKIQNDKLCYLLKLMIPDKDKNWLDLGCGSCRLLKYIRKFSISGYLGIDIDLDQIVIGQNIIDSKIFIPNRDKIDDDKVRISNGNLKDEDWSKFTWDLINENNKLVKKKFDYVVSNFSISHFISDNFWKNLNKLTNKNCKFMFNCVNVKIESVEWRLKDYYMRYDNSTNKIIMKFPTHDEEVEELYLSEYTIRNYIDKYGWEVIHKSESKFGTDLSTYYDWYIIEKK